MSQELEIKPVYVLLVPSPIDKQGRVIGAYSTKPRAHEARDRYTDNSRHVGLNPSTPSVSKRYAVQSGSMWFLLAHHAARFALDEDLFLNVPKLQESLWEKASPSERELLRQAGIEPVSSITVNGKGL
jgi:hypothetical protein